MDELTKKVSFNMESRINVLFVEDESADYELAVHELRKTSLHFVPHRASSIDEARSKLNLESLDAVVSDFNLRNGNGWDVLQVVQSLKPELPFILVTATLGDEQAVEFMKKGASDYILKANLSRLPFAITSAVEKGRAAAALKNSEATLSLIFESSPDAITISTLHEGRYVRVNRCFEKVTEYSRQELIGKDAQELGLWLHLMPRQEMVARLFREGTVRGYEAKFKGKSGKVTDLELSLELIRIGDEPHILATYRDLTEYKLMELRKSQSQKLEAVGQLAGGVAHDFNNILGIIMGHTELLSPFVEENDEAKPRISAILTAAQRAAKLTHQLLSFSRQQLTQPQQLNLNQAVEETYQLVERTIEENIRIRLELDKQKIVVNVDPSQMQQILLNLVINARDAMPKGGEITIETGTVDMPDGPLHHSGMMPAGNYGLTTVTDTGLGMTEEVKQHIFEPFFTTKARGKGTGLGLATVYGIVKQSGGFIWVYSELGRGTTFKVYLPRVESKGIASAHVLKEPTNGGGHESVLLVEDDPNLRQLFQEVLSKKGFSVETAEDAESALQKTRSSMRNFDIVVTDIVMPGVKTGAELAQDLKALNPRLKVLLLSGYTQNSAILRELLSHGGSFLQKPFSAAQLVEKVRQVLDEQF
jgi:two-component system cell cycle sensor histidine kinase/response regulator CckA